MKRLAALVVLVAVLPALVLFGVADSAASVANTSVRSNEVASRANETDNSDSATATITVTMGTAPLSEERVS